MDLTLAPEALAAPPAGAIDPAAAPAAPAVEFDLEAALARLAGAAPPWTQGVGLPQALAKPTPAGDARSEDPATEADEAPEAGSGLPLAIAGLPPAAPLTILVAPPPAPVLAEAQITASAGLEAPRAQFPVKQALPSQDRANDPQAMSANPLLPADPPPTDLPPAPTPAPPPNECGPEAIAQPTPQADTLAPPGDAALFPVASAPVSAIAAPAAPRSGGQERDQSRDRAEVVVEAAPGGALRVAFDRPDGEAVGVTLERGEDGATDLRMAVASAVTRDLVEIALPSLADTLAARGVELGRVAVDVGHAAADPDRRAPRRDGAEHFAAPAPSRAWIRSVAAARRAGFTAYA